MVRYVIRLAQQQTLGNPSVILQHFGGADVRFQQEGLLIEIRTLRDDEFMHEKWLQRGFMKEELEKPWWLIINRGATYEPMRIAGLDCWNVKQVGNTKNHTHLIPKTDGGYKVIQLKNDLWQNVDVATDLEHDLVATTMVLSLLPTMIHAEFPDSFQDFTKEIMQELG